MESLSAVAPPASINTRVQQSLQYSPTAALTVETEQNIYRHNLPKGRRSQQSQVPSPTACPVIFARSLWSRLLEWYLFFGL